MVSLITPSSSTLARSNLTTGSVSNWWANYWRDMSPIEVNFLLFSSVFSLITTIYLSLAAFNKLPAVANNRFALLAADAMTMTFWFASFIALAVFLSSRVCFGNVCNVAKASVAFGAFNWYADTICPTLQSDTCANTNLVGFSSPSQLPGQACTLSAVVAPHKSGWNHQCRKAHNLIWKSKKNTHIFSSSFHGFKTVDLSTDNEKEA